MPVFLSGLVEAVPSTEHNRVKAIINSSCLLCETCTTPSADRPWKSQIAVQRSRDSRGDSPSVSIGRDLLAWEKCGRRRPRIDAQDEHKCMEHQSSERSH